MEDELKNHFEALMAEFTCHSRLAKATIWARAAGDARFLDRVNTGSGFTVKTYDRVVQWFSDNWPDGAEWPPSIERRPIKEAGQARVPFPMTAEAEAQP